MTGRNVKDISVESLPPALRDKQYCAGDLICKAEPFAHVISANANGAFCDLCAKPPSTSRLLKCGACKYEHYCNKRCQKKAWTYHKFECPLLKAISPRIPPDSVRLITKILWKLAKGVKTVEDDPGWRDWYDLCPQLKHCEEDSKRRDAFLKVMYTVNMYISQDTIAQLGLKTGDEMTSELGRMSFNGYTLTSMGVQEIGAAVYLSPSVFNHSCAPNAVHVCDGTTLYVRALEDIDTTKEAIFVNYVDPMSPRAERQATLYDDYHFMCRCVKCADLEGEAKLESSVCPTCSDQVLHTENENGETTMTCIKCNAEIEDSFYQDKCQKAVAEGAKLIKDALKHDFVGMKELTAYLEKTSGLLHEHHVTRNCIKNTLYAVLSEQGKDTEAYQLGEEITPTFYLYYPENYSTHGLHQFKQARLAWHLDLYDKALKHYEDAHKMMRLTYGPDHTLTQTALSDVEECKRDSVMYQQFHNMKS